MQFKNPSIDSRYRLNVDKDQEVRVPGQYKGMLSEIDNEDVIKGMIARKSNLISPKNEKPATAEGKAATK